MIFGLWNGGSSYADGYLDNDLERFESIDTARAALDSRAINGHWCLQDFDYVNRPAERALCPTVEGSYMDLYFADPTGDTDPVPDMRLKQGGEARNLGHAASEAVFIGGSLPAHDQVFDLAVEVGESLESMRTYITGVRDAEQANAAVTELLEALLAASKQEVTA
jgi:hypothetical protein